MKVYCFGNNKGGVGKTTSSVSISAEIAARGKKVLLIDLDSQGNAGVSLGVSVKSLPYTIYDLLFQEAQQRALNPVKSEPISIDDVILRDGETVLNEKKEVLWEGKYGIDLLPSNFTLMAYENFTNTPRRDNLLQSVLAGITGYDYVFIDTAPSFSLLTENALTAADAVIIPVQLENLSLQGMADYVSYVRRAQKTYNANLRIAGIIGTMYANTKEAQTCLTNLENYAPDYMFKTVIRRNTKAAEATAYGMPIFLYDPKANSAKDYQDAVTEFLQREEGIA